MNRARLFLSASITLGVTTAIGCGTSSSNPASPDGGGSRPVADAAALDGSGDSGEGALGASCNPFSNTLCSRGQTCCFSGLQGTCTLLGACRNAFQIGCTSQASCPAGEACCGSGTGASLSFSCESACAGDEFQLCRSDPECPAGMTCTLVARGFTTKVCRAVPDGGPVAEDSGDDAEDVSDAGTTADGAADATTDAASTDGGIIIGDAAEGG